MCKRAATDKKEEFKFCTFACRYADLNGMAVRQLYLRGLVWLEVPVRPEDHLSIPPLEASLVQPTQRAKCVAGSTAVADNACLVRMQARVPT